MDQKRIGVIYARYSSHNQNDESIEQQVKECLAFAQTHGIRITGTYADRALTGRSDKRPEFQRMMRAAASHAFDVVLSYKSNRISRNMLHALAYEDKLAKVGVEVVYCKEEFGNNAAGRFALRTMMNVNQFYSENMAEDITRGMLDNARQCKVNGPLPYGYRRGADGRMEIVPAEADIVREIFRRIADDETCVDVMESLNARRIPTSTGGMWKQNSVQRMLRNDRYTGIYRYGNVRIEGGCPQIIQRNLFDRVQQKLDMRGSVNGRRRKSSEYILTGKLYCGVCGRQLRGVSGRSRHGCAYHYYQCAGWQEKQCSRSPIRREKLDGLVINALTRFVLNDSVTIEWLIDAVMEQQEQRKRSSDISRWRRQLEETEASIRNLLRALESGVIAPAVNERLTELGTQRNDLASRIRHEEASIQSVTRDQVRAWLQSFNAGKADDPAFSRKLVSSFIDCVYLYDTAVAVLFSYQKEDNGAAIVSIKKAVDTALEGSYLTAVVKQQGAYTIQKIGKAFMIAMQVS